MRPLICLCILLVSLFSCTRNESGGENNLLIDPSFISSSFKDKSVITIGADSHYSLLPLIVANRGYKASAPINNGEQSSKFNLSVESQTSLLLSRLARGEYSVVILPLFEYLHHRSSIADSYPQIFYLCGWSNGLHGIFTKTLSAQRITDLAGTTIHTVEESSAYHLTRFMMQQSNMPPDSVNWEYVKDENSLTRILARGSYETVAAGMPKLKNPKNVLTTKQVSRFIPYVAVTTGKQIIASELTVRETIASINKGNALLLNDSNKSLSIIKEAGIENETANLSLKFFLPASYNENLSFFGIEQKLSPDIYDLLYYDRLSNESADVRPMHAYHSLFVTEPLLSTELEESITRLKRPEFETPNGIPSPLISISLPVSESTKITAVAQKNALLRAAKLHAMMPQTAAEISFIPAENSSSPYFVRRHLENTTRYIREEELFDTLPSIDYRTLSAIENRRYEGPYAEYDQIIINLLESGE